MRLSAGLRVDLRDLTEWGQQCLRLRVYSRRVRLDRRFRRGTGPNDLTSVADQITSVADRGATIAGRCIAEGGAGSGRSQEQADETCRGRQDVGG